MTSKPITTILYGLMALITRQARSRLNASPPFAQIGRHGSFVGRVVGCEKEIDVCAGALLQELDTENVAQFLSQFPVGSGVLGHGGPRLPFIAALVCGHATDLQVKKE